MACVASGINMGYRGNFEKLADRGAHNPEVLAH